MINQVVIIGGHIQALGLVRQANKLNIKVLLLIPDGFSVARFSNSVHEVKIFKSIEEIEILLEKYAKKDTLIVPTSDEYIEYLSANYEQFRDKYTLSLPSISAIQFFSNKRSTHLFAKEHRIPHPKSWCPDTIDDINNIAKQVEYPIIIKPAVMYDFHKQFGKKAFLCNCEKDLLNKCKHVIESYPINKLLIQEFLPGGPKYLYSYGVFAVEGNPLAWVTANRIRQNPMDFGNSTTFAITCNIPEIEEAARKILLNTQYTGLAEVEFMYDDKCGEYKFLEVNTRAWKWHSISEALGFGFLSEMIKHLNGENTTFKSQKEKVAWQESLTDYTIIAKEILKGKMDLKEVLKSSKHIKKVNAVWNWKDPIPGIMYILLSPILFFKRY